jgi:hypothetical protein
MGALAGVRQSLAELYERSTSSTSPNRDRLVRTGRWEAA